MARFLRDRPALGSFIAISAADELGSQMLNVGIGWYVYAATDDPMSLAWVGLTRFVPTIALALVAGQAADRLDRRKLIAVSLLLQTLCIAAFAVLTAVEAPSVLPVYLLLLVNGAAHSFSSPALSATLPNLVGAQDFPRAVATASSVFQLCSLIGPALGGLIYAVSGPGMFAVAGALYLLALMQVRRLPGVGRALRVPGETTDESVWGGIRYIRGNRLLLALISLDLFAVLLGGRDGAAADLRQGHSRGRAGRARLPALRARGGAAIVGFGLAHRPIRRGAGRLMLGCVAGFGLATVVFALSRNVWLSLAALAAAGGFDMVSMVIRQILVQIATPDAMRGRVSAVNGVFIGASSELGEFESGFTAALFGTVPAALIGGLGTLAVVALWARLFPELPRADKLAPSATGPDRPS
jgi:MFS family permease